MCGRFFLDTDVKDIMEHYNEPPPDIFSARYNIAPTTPVLACTEKGLTLFRWGFDSGDSAGRLVKRIYPGFVFG